MDEREGGSLDELDRALGMAFGPPTWTEGGGVLPWIEQSTGLRLRTSLLPLEDDAQDGTGSGDADLEEDAQFEFLGELARGGVGIVYRCRDRDLRREVAIKILQPELARRRDVLMRFIEEAQVCGQLAHPGIVPVYGLALLHDGRTSIAMKLVRGVTLADVLDTVGDRTAELPRLLGLFEQLAATVGYAHARRVVHRDLKPANVMIGAFGELQVMDWGFAKVLGRAEGEACAAPREVVTVRSVNGEAHSMLGSIMGTPAYMPPEQARGRVTSVDERADVFALGSTLCEILTGEPVYTGTPAERLHKAIGSEVAEAHERLDAANADAPLVELARRCIATEPDERPRDAAAVADAVRTYREAVQERAEEAELERARAEALELEAQRRAAWERRARRQSRVLALATGVAVLLALGVWTWTRARSQQRLDDAVAAAEAALDDADRAGASGNLIAALGAARRAVEQLDGQPNHPARSRAVRVEQGLLGRLEREGDERRRAAEDTRIRDRLAVVPRPGAPGIDDEARRAAFDRAFAACGLDLSSLPVDSAVAWIRARGPEARDALIASLDRRALLRRGGETGGPSATRLLAVAGEADADPWRRRMRDAIATGDADAVASLSDELGSDDDAERLSVDLAGLALDAFDQGEATVTILRRIRDRHPTSPDVQLALARRLGSGPPLARMEARRCLNAAVTIDPTLDDVWVALGDLHAAQGKTDQAEATWRAGTRHGPRSDLPYLRLAAHLAATERADEALALLDGRLTELESTEPLDRETRGLALGHWLTTPELGALRDETRGARWGALWQRVRTLREGAAAGGAR